MASNIYRLYCEICNYNKITDGTDLQLREYKRSPIMSETPKYDVVTKKTTQKEFIKLPRKFKCPQCGRLISPRKISQDENKTENAYDKDFDPRSERGSER